MSAEDPRYSQAMIYRSDAKREKIRYEQDRPQHRLRRDFLLIGWSGALTFALGLLEYLV